MPYIDVSKLKETLLWQPTAVQEDILANMKRLTTVISARRVGKSTLGAYVAIREALCTDRRVWIVAPYFSLTKVIFNYVSGWVTRYFPDSFQVNQSDLTIRCRPSRSIIECKTADNPTSLRGQSVSLLIMDECSEIPEDVWQHTLRAAIAETRPELGGAKGRLLAFSNPPYYGTWFSELYHQDLPEKYAVSVPLAIEDERGEVVQSTNPGVVSVDELRIIKASVSQRVWEREYLAREQNEAGTVFTQFRDCITEGVLRPPQRGRRYVGGLDLARLQDETCLVIIDRDTHEVVYLGRWSHLDWSFQKAKVATIATDYNRAKLIIDRTGVGEVIFNELQRSGLNVEPFVFTSDSKKDLVEKLSVFLETRRVSIPDDEELIRQLDAFSYKLTATGRVQYGAPSGIHDDMVIALGLAVSDLSDTPKIVSGWTVKDASNREVERLLANRSYAKHRRRGSEYR